jgi:hypothetical protein
MRDGICIAELGEIVDNKEECSTGKVFGENICSCRSDEFYQPNMRSCIKSVGAIGFSCTQQSQCSPFGAAFCPSPEVFPRNCECYDYAVFNEEKQLCEPKSGLGKYCDKDEECQGISNAVCNSNRCICSSNYVETGEVCKAGHDAICQDVSECAFENSECKNATCMCKSDYAPSTTGCYEKAKSVNSSCIVNEQCFSLLGDKSTCIEGKCGCDIERLHLKEGKCNDKKLLGEQCSKSANCYLENDEEKLVECRNGYCQCRNGKSDYVTKRCYSQKEKNSSSTFKNPFKIITMILITSALLIFISAIRDVM